jgi:hypothetical protein
MKDYSFVKCSVFECFNHAVVIAEYKTFQKDRNGKIVKLSLCSDHSEWFIPFGWMLSGTIRVEGDN